MSVCILYVHVCMYVYVVIVLNTVNYIKALVSFPSNINIQVLVRSLISQWLLTSRVDILLNLMPLRIQSCCCCPEAIIVVPERQNSLLDTGCNIYSFTVFCSYTWQRG